MKIIRRLLLESAWLLIGILAGLAVWLFLGNGIVEENGDYTIQLHDSYLVVEGFQLKVSLLAALLVNWIVFFFRTVLQAYRVWLSALFFILLTGGIWLMLRIVREFQVLACESTAAWTLYAPLGAVPEEPPARYAGYHAECDLAQQVLGASEILLFVLAGLTLLVSLIRIFSGRGRV